MEFSRDDLVDWLRRDEWHLFVTLTSPRGLRPHSYKRALTGLLNHYGRLVGLATPWQAVGNCEPHAMPNEDGTPRLHCHALVRYATPAIMSGSAFAMPRLPAVRKHRMRQLVVKQQAYEHRQLGKRKASPDKYQLASWRWLSRQLDYPAPQVDFEWFVQWWGHIYWHCIFQAEYLRSTTKASFYITKTLKYALKNYDVGTDNLILAPDL